MILSHSGRDGRAPQAIWVSITPFGLTGPRAHWRGSDLTCMAAGTGMNVTGDPDRAPLRCSEPASHAHTGGEVVIAALTALASGMPQDVDVSMQELLLVTQMNAPARWPTEGNRGSRRGARTGLTTETWPCADGYVSFGLRGGKARVKNLQTFTALAEADGVATAAVSRRDWDSFDPAALTPEELAEIEGVVAACFAKHTMRELYDHAVATGLMLAPASNASDIINSTQLASRHALTALGDIVRPAPRLWTVPDRMGPARRSDHWPPPHWEPRPCPLLIRSPRQDGPGKVSRSSNWAAARPARSPPATSPITAPPWCALSPTPSRTSCVPTAPNPSNSTGSRAASSSAASTAANSTSRSTCRNPAAIELARRLCTEWADAVVENFAPGAMAKWGLDFESLAASKPDVVMASGCIWGNTGPERSYPGFGGQGAALSGYTHLTGWADRRPVGLSGTATATRWHRDSWRPPWRRRSCIRSVPVRARILISHRSRWRSGPSAPGWPRNRWASPAGRDGNRHPHVKFPASVFASSRLGRREGPLGRAGRPFG